jgi:uncharacterized protein
MRLICIIWILVAVSFPVFGQTGNTDYDPELAKKLGADDYGMKSYILVILKTGSNTTADKELTSKSFAGHMSNMERLAEEGKLIVAGPIGKNEKSYRGIFILDVASLEEANGILQTDPAIKENLLAADLYKWYGSAALPEYLDAARKIWKIKP